MLGPLDFVAHAQASLCTPKRHVHIVRQGPVSTQVLLPEFERQAVDSSFAVVLGRRRPQVNDVPSPCLDDARMAGRVVRPTRCVPECPWAESKPAGHKLTREIVTRQFWPWPQF